MRTGEAFRGGAPRATVSDYVDDDRLKGGEQVIQKLIPQCRWRRSGLFLEKKEDGTGLLQAERPRKGTCKPPTSVMEMKRAVRKKAVPLPQADGKNPCITLVVTERSGALGKKASRGPSRARRQSTRPRAPCGGTEPRTPGIIRQRKEGGAPVP